MHKRHQRFRDEETCTKDLKRNGRPKSSTGRDVDHKNCFLNEEQ